MLFVLPEYDLAFSAFVHETVRELARARSPLLSTIPHEPQAGGVSSRVRGRDGLDVDLPGRGTAYEFSVPVDAIRAGDFDPLVVALDQASDVLAKDMVEMVIQHISLVTEATGNVVKSNGPLTFETWLELMESFEWSLDDDGNLSEPSLVIHPDAVKNLPELTPEQSALIDKLKQRKYEEAVARRRRRRLS